MAVPVDGLLNLRCTARVPWGVGHQFFHFSKQTDLLLRTPDGCVRKRQTQSVVVLSLLLLLLLLLRPACGRSFWPMVRTSGQPARIHRRTVTNGSGELSSGRSGSVYAWLFEETGKTLRGVGRPGGGFVLFRFPFNETRPMG